MKKISLILSFVIVAALLLTISVSAALPGTGWRTAYDVMNVGGSSGKFDMTAYESAGSSTYSATGFAFDDKEALTYDPAVAANYPTGRFINFSSLPNGFLGSVVLSSSVDVASAATLSNSAVTKGTAIARYQAIGSSVLATEILFPSVKHNYYNQTTTFYIQAAGSEADVTMTFAMNDGSVHTQTQTIGANKMFIFDPINATPPVASINCGTDANTSPCFGAASAVSSSGDIAGVYVEHPHIGSPAAFALSTRGLTDSDKATTIFAPTTKNYYYDATAGFTVMNTGTAPANAQITLSVTGVQPNSAAAKAGVKAGDVFVDNEIIPPGQSLVFGPFNNNLGGMPKGTFAAAIVTSIDDATYDPQLLAGVSNEAKKTTLLSGGNAKAVYYGYAPSQATSQLACPVVTELVSNQTGGMSVVNVGIAPATIHFEYVLYNGLTYHVWTKNPIDPGKAIGTNRISTNPGGNFMNDGTWPLSELAGKVFSVYAYTDNGEEIIALNQEAATNFSNDIRNYECINLPAALP